MTRQKLLQFDWEVLIHPLYSPVTLDVYLFQFLQNYINRKKFISLEDCKGIKNSSLFKKMKSLGRWKFFFFSVTESCLTLQLHGLQHTRLPFPSPSPRACSNSYPLSQWCHSTSSSVIPLSCLQSFPVSGSFLLSWLFVSGAQTIGVSASASVLPMNIQDWFSSGWTGWISLLSQGLSRIFSNTIIQKHQFIDTHPSLTHSSVLAWRIPRMVETGGMLSMGLHRIGHDWSDLAAAAAAPFFYGPTLTSTHGHWKAPSLTIRIFVGK